MRIRVFPAVEAPSQARRELGSLADRIDQSSLMTVRTVVSELVGMSVANGAREPIEVGLRLEDGWVDGVLRDDGTGARVIRRRDGSLVLRIVDGLVEDWGMTSDGGQGIWFRVNVQPTSEAAIEGRRRSGKMGAMASRLVMGQELPATNSGCDARRSHPSLAGSFTRGTSATRIGRASTVSTRCSQRKAL
jgi:hypothetical protein